MIENPVPKHVLNSICDFLENDKVLFSKYTSDASENPDSIIATLTDLLKFLWSVSQEDLCLKLGQSFSPAWNISEITTKCDQVHENFIVSPSTSSSTSSSADLLLLSPFKNFMNTTLKAVMSAQNANASANTVRTSRMPLAEEEKTTSTKVFWALEKSTQKQLLLVLSDGVTIPTEPSPKLQTILLQKMVPWFRICSKSGSSKKMPQFVAVWPITLAMEIS